MIVFVKNPVKGKVKTRLAKRVGEDVALDIYLQLLNNTRNLLKTINAGIYIFYSDFIDENYEWGRPVMYNVQSSGPLGLRMVQALKKVLPTYKKVLLIGSDCPGLTTSVVEDAFNGLDGDDVVIGPAVDGGYYLIGLKVESPFLFQDINWSTDKVFNETAEKVQSNDLTLLVLPELRDVDEEEDYLYYLKKGLLF